MEKKTKTTKGKMEKEKIVGTSPLEEPSLKKNPREEKVRRREPSGKDERKVESGKCNDRDCPFHGCLKTHGRVFEGTVTKKFPRRVVIEFERTIYVRKYERYARAKTKIHARLPNCLEDEIKVGDYIKVQECRPLSKIVHFVVIEKIRSGEIAKVEVEEGKKEKKI